MSQLGDVDHAVEDKIHLDSPSRNQLDSPHHNCDQVKDWIKFKEGTGHSAPKQGQLEERKRTGVDCKHDNRNHQDNLTLVRTQDPSPPDDDTVGDNKLKSSERRVSSRGIFTGDVRV